MQIQMVDGLQPLIQTNLACCRLWAGCAHHSSESPGMMDSAIIACAHQLVLQNGSADGGPDRVKMVARWSTKVRIPTASDSIKRHRIS